MVPHKRGHVADRIESNGQKAGILHADMIRILFVSRKAGEGGQVKSLAETLQSCGSTVNSRIRDGRIAGLADALEKHVPADWGGRDWGNRTSRTGDAADTAGV